MKNRTVLLAGALTAALCVITARAETWIEYRSGPDPRSAPRAYGYPQGVAPYPSGPYGNQPPRGNDGGYGVYGNGPQSGYPRYQDPRGGYGYPPREQAYRDEGDHHRQRRGRDDDGYRHDNDRYERRGRQDERHDYDDRDERRSQGGFVMRQRPTQRRYPPPAYGPYSAPGHGQFEYDERPYRR